MAAKMISGMQFLLIRAFFHVINKGYNFSRAFGPSGVPLG
jgi:hypothetical protein